MTSTIKKRSRAQASPRARTWSPKVTDPRQLDLIDDWIHVADAAKPVIDKLTVVDRWGHLHSEKVFDNWTPEAIAACGIRREVKK